MARYKIFCDKKESRTLPSAVRILEAYPAFCVIQATEAQVKKLRKQYPVEKLTTRASHRTRGLTELKALADENNSNSNEYRVQFHAPVKKSWLKELADAGGQVSESLGNSSVLVSCKTAKDLQRIQELNSVKNVVGFSPIVRLSPTFIDGLRKGKAKTAKQLEKSINEAAESLASGRTTPPTGRTRNVPGAIVASFFSVKDASAAQKALNRFGAKTSYSAESKRLVVNLNSAKEPVEALKSLVQRKGLKKIEELKLSRLANNVARQVIGGGVVNSNPAAKRLTGKGEIIAVADSGLDTGNPDTMHADFKGRIVDIASFPIDPRWNDFITNPGGDDGAADEVSGHGTHVAGSVLGNGARATTLGLSENIQGVAPEAKLVFQAIEQRPDWTPDAQLEFLLSGEQPPQVTLFGIPDDLNDLFQAAFDKGARIHNNSWGGGSPGSYDSQCEDLDEFVWNHKDFLVVVAAGNSGTDVSPKNGTIDQISVDSPGTAKNCLTVGASENDRKSEFNDTYGEWWPNDFSKNPIKNDSMVDNINDVVAFSSRGPCTTGRRKPDVVAPGTFVLSTRSSRIAENNFAWGAFPPAKKDYMYMGGTSMAAPLVAGCAAVVRQFLRSEVGISKPSAAMIKAAVIHSAQYKNYRFAHQSSNKFADNEQGWGRVDMKSIISPQMPRKVIFAKGAGLSTGGSKEFKVEISNNSAPLKVTLAYTDFPGEDLVNNLNLLVTSPTGEFLFGNDFNNSGAPDNLNNVEGVFVKSPKKGIWTIKVIASEVLEGTQDFAIVISGPGAKLL